MNLARRVRALERTVGVGTRCDLGGHEPGVVRPVQVSFADKPGDDRLNGRDFCPKCGATLVLRITFEEPREAMTG